MFWLKTALAALMRLLSLEPVDIAVAATARLRSMGGIWCRWLGTEAMFLSASVGHCIAAGHHAFAQLTDPRRREWMVVLVLVAYVAIWTVYGKVHE